MISVADREPPGCPLPAVDIMVITWRRSFLAISLSSVAEKLKLLAVCTVCSGGLVKAFSMEAGFDIFVSYYYKLR